MRRLIAILTCHKYAYRAQAVRDTWVQDIPAAHFDYRFFVGEGDGPVHPDTVVLPCGDGYGDVPAKVRAMFGWSHAQGYDLTFKTDDDCYVVPNLIAKMNFGTHDYIGRMRGPSGGYPADYASGFAYALSKKAARIISTSLPNQDWAEDRFVGNVLANAGVQAWSDDQSFAPFSPPLTPEVLVTTNVNHCAVFCEFPDPKHIRQMHDLRHKLNPLKSGFPMLRPVATRKVTAQDLLRPPTDLPDWAKQQRQGVYAQAQ